MVTNWDYEGGKKTEEAAICSYNVSALVKIVVNNNNNNNTCPRCV